MENVKLPDSWVQTRLDEISDIILGQSPPSSTYNENRSGLPFYQGKLEFGNIYPTPQKWCTEPKKIAEKGDVLISVRAPVGPTNICPEKSCIGRGLAAIRPLGGIETLFILYFLRAFENAIAGKGTGTTFNAITGDQLRGFELPFPPLPEQRRIVTKLEELFTRLDAGVSALQKTQAQLKRYRQSVLKAACEGKLVPTEAELALAEGRAYEPAEVLLARINDIRKRNTKGKYIEMPTLDISDLPKLPEGWLWVQAQDVCNWITNGYTPKANKMFQGNGEIPFIKVYNLTNKGELDFSKNPTFISKETHTKELSRSNVFPGDILMNIVGPPLGKVSIVPDIFPEWNINQAIVIYRPLEGFDRKFLCYSLLTDNILSWAIKRSKATAGQFNLTITICRNLPLPLPPLAEQRRIVAEVERRLSVADEVARTVEHSLAQAQRLRQSILKKAFEGRLVAQNPEDDEPANVLLEKIRLQKQLGIKKGRGNR